jgi:hypothetical protein
VLVLQFESGYSMSLGHPSENELVLESPVQNMIAGSMSLGQVDAVESMADSCYCRAASVILLVEELGTDRN